MRPETVSFRSSTLSFPFLPPWINRRIKPTPRFHPPPWNREGGVALRSKDELERPQNRRGQRLRRDSFSKSLATAADPSAGNHVPRPFGGVENSKQKQGFCSGLRCGGDGGGWGAPERARASGAGAAPQPEGGHAVSRMKPGLWGRGGGGRGEGSDAGPGAPLRRGAPTSETAPDAPGSPNPLRTRRRGPVEARLRHGEWAQPGSRGFLCSWSGLARARGGGSECPPLVPACDSGPALSSASGVGARRRRDAGGLDGEARRLKTILWCSPRPALFMSRRLARVVRWDWRPRGISRRRGAVWARGGLAFCPPTGGPRHLLALGLGSLPLGYIRSRHCRRGWERLGGWTPVRGASGAGSPGGAGLGSLLPPLLCSVARLSLPSPLLCKAPARKTGCGGCPRCIPRAGGPPPHGFRWGTPSGHRRPGTVSCLWNGREARAGRSDPAQAGGCAHGPSPCHTSLAVGEGCAGVLEDVTDPLARSSPGSAGAPSLEVLAPALFCPLPLPSPPPGYSL